MTRFRAFLAAHRGTLKFLFWTAVGGAAKAVFDGLTTGTTNLDPGQAAIAGALLRYVWQTAAALATGETKTAPTTTGG